MLCIELFGGTAHHIERVSTRINHQGLYSEDAPVEIELRVLFGIDHAAVVRVVRNRLMQPARALIVLDAHIRLGKWMAK